MTIEDDRVMVVALGHREDDVDVEPSRGFGQAVREDFASAHVPSPRGVARGSEVGGKDFIRRLVGTQQELTLRAATGDHVELVLEDLARTRHGCGISNPWAAERPRDHANIDAGGVRYSDCWGLAFNPGPVLLLARIQQVLTLSRQHRR